jgi:DNA-binding CsgD family transcriptional regulator
MDASPGTMARPTGHPVSSPLTWTEPTPGFPCVRAGSTRPGRPDGSRPPLRGRHRERNVLEDLVASVRAGESRALVLRGEGGVGKTALLDYVARHAVGCDVTRGVGVESEMELAFAGLQQLCAPFIGRLAGLPAPQRDALASAFGLREAAPPDRFLIGLAVLSLLADAAQDRPVVCVVDDAQWLDCASKEVLSFAARRLGAESVAFVFAARESGDEPEFVGLPELVVRGLGETDARAVLMSAVPGPLDEHVVDRIVAETRGNPLALLELPSGLTPDELAGGFGLLDAPALSSRIEESFRRRLHSLPSATRWLLLVAAAEPVGDPVLVWRAAAQLEVGAEAAQPAISAGLLAIGGHVRFRHPLVRSAVYQAAPPDERARVHVALADAADPAVDPDRRAWHRAQATPGLDEDVAGELERSAGRARARGGMAAAAAFQERAALLTPESARRAERALVAAQSKYVAGAADASLRLLAMAQAGPLVELDRARAELIRAQVAASAGRGRDAPTLLLDAARRLEPLHASLARETYRDAFYAALTAGRLAATTLSEVARTVVGFSRGEESESTPRPEVLLLDGLAVLIVEGYAAGAPMLKDGLRAVREQEVCGEGALHWLPLACRMAHDVWDDETWYALSSLLVARAREVGALAVLPTGLLEGLALQLFSGEFATAAAMGEEAEAVALATGNPLGPYGRLVLAAWRGDEAETSRLIAATTPEMMTRGEGQWLTTVQWASAVLDNGLGRYDAALTAAEQGSENPDELGLATWSMVELIEAAARTGAPGRAESALRRLSETTAASGTEWALGIAAQSQALVSDAEVAERFYQEAIDRLGRTRMRLALARAHLVYGEWLRREKRRIDARQQLRCAYEMLQAMGIDAFAERARRELLATGDKLRKRTVDTVDQLTAQELQIARLASEGRTNPEIATQLFISARTVEWHLGNVFVKLGIGSRRELSEVLPTLGRSAVSTVGRGPLTGSSNPGR